MARKDEILKSFLEHNLLKDKYNIVAGTAPNTVREALNSSIPIIKAIALIVENLESAQSITDKTLRDIITQYLSNNAL